MDFVAIDFETATSKPASICSMGICVVKNNEVVKTEELLIKPQPFEFNEYNVKIHGITPEAVFCCPTFDKYWDRVLPYLENKTVIAHNASFDITALKRTLDYYSIEYPCFQYLCTVILSRKAYPEMPGHKLNELMREFNISFSHHNAEEDAYACAMVMKHIIRDFDIECIEDFNKRFGVLPSRVFPGCDEKKDVHEEKKNVKKEGRRKNAYSGVRGAERNGKKLPRDRRGAGQQNRGNH